MSVNIIMYTIYCVSVYYCCAYYCACDNVAYQVYKVRLLAAIMDPVSQL